MARPARIVLLVVAVIVLSSAAAAYAAVTRLLHPHPVTHLAAVAAAAAVGFAGNELVARYRISTGRRIVAVAAAGAIGVVGFAVAGGYAVEGYTDLVWAAFAVGAVIWGLVLPRSPRALAVA